MRFVYILLAILGASTVATAQVHYYSTTDGNWHDVANWTNSAGTESLPGTDDIVHVRNHAMSITQHVQVGSLNLTTGAVSIAHAQQLVLGPGFTTEWTQASVQGPGSVLNQGTISIWGLTTTQVAAAFMTNQGIMQVQANSVQINGTFNNSPGGFFGLTTTMVAEAHAFQQMYGTGVFNNAGTVSFQSLPGTTSEWSLAFQNQGTLMLGTGNTVNAFGGGSHSNALISMYTGSVFNVQGTNFFTGTFATTGMGTVVMSGTMNIGVTGATFNAQGGGIVVESGTINPWANSSLNNHGNLTFGSLNATTTMLSGGVIANYGNLQFGPLGGTTGSTFRTTAVATVSNAPSGVVTVSGNNPQITGFGLFHNSGYVVFSPTGIVTITTPYLQHGGTSVFVSGSISLQGQMTGGLLSMNGGQWVGGQSWYMFGGNMGGSGQIGNNLYQDSGRLSPGASPGIMEIDGFLLQTGTDPELYMEVGGLEPGTAHDQIVVSSTGTVSGVLTVTLLDGYEPPPATRINLLMAEQIYGHFAATNLPALSGDAFFVVRYLTNAVQLRVATSLDTDGDGLPDTWELDRFGDLDASDGGADDFDDDGYTDAQELVADTDPADASSYLRMLGAEPGPPVMVQFEPGSTGRVYTLHYTDDLAGGEWLVVPGTEPRPGAGGTDAMVDTNAVPERAFRIQVEWP